MYSNNHDSIHPGPLEPEESNSSRVGTNSKLLQTKYITYIHTNIHTSIQTDAPEQPYSHGPTGRLQTEDGERTTE